MLQARQLQRHEIEKIWTIDRREVIDHVYHIENGVLTLKAEHYDVTGWPEGEIEDYRPVLEECYDQGGWFYGLFEEQQLIGVVVLESRFIGEKQDTLQFKFFHVSSAYRGRGLGRQLFDEARHKAREKGAKWLYISATPSEHTVHFYQQQGSILAEKPDPDLFAFEPDDIHLVCPV